ncbi:hypothetical protein LXL04_022018 [Taraxacum kok-saghyz]
MSTNSDETNRSPSPATFGEPWPEFNDGLTYRDLVRLPDSGPSFSLQACVYARFSKCLTLIDFYSIKHQSSAPLLGWLQRIENGQITVNDTIVTDPNTVLRTGAKLVYHRRPWKEPYAPHLLEILFEDDHLIALNKPSGLQVLPGGLFQQRTLLTQLQWHIKNQESCPVPVHRLGRGTSGILLCAKTKLAKTRVSALFAEKTSAVVDNRKVNSEVNKVVKMSKIYRALVCGIINEDEVVIEQPIGTSKYPGVAKGLYVASPSGKPALSKVHVLKRDLQNNQTIVQVEIQSGRPHQIRIHLSFIGHPLLGDPLYVIGGIPKCCGSETIDETFAEDGGYNKPANPVPGDCGYYLHAHQLLFCHPITNKVCRITASLPNHLSC